MKALKDKASTKLAIAWAGTLLGLALTHSHYFH